MYARVAPVSDIVAVKLRPVALTQNAYFSRLPITVKDTAVDRVIDWIFSRNGMTTVKDACAIAGVGE